MLSRAATTPTFVRERERERRGRLMERGRREDILVEVGVAGEFDMIGRRGNSIIDLDELVGEYRRLLKEVWMSVSCYAITVHSSEMCAWDEVIAASSKQASKYRRAQSCRASRP